MYCFYLLSVCVFLNIQSIFCQYPGKPLPNMGPYGYNAPGYGPGFPMGLEPSFVPDYGGTGIGEVEVVGEMPVSGITAVAGQVPVQGRVRFGGDIAAGGTISVFGGCGCGANVPFV